MQIKHVIYLITKFYYIFSSVTKKTDLLIHLYIMFSIAIPNNTTDFTYTCGLR